MPPFHKQLGSTFLDSIALSSPRFTFYLTERGLGQVIARAYMTDLGNNAMVGEAMWDLCLADLMLNEGIPSEYYGSISTHMVEPAIFHALVQREPLQFENYAPESTLPPAIVALFVGTLLKALGFEELQVWFRNTMGSAVRAAAKVCADYSSAVEEGAMRKWARPTERERNLNRLAEAAKALSGAGAPPPEPLIPLPQARMPLFDSRLLGVPHTWSSYARKTTAKLLAAAREEYKTFKSTAFPKDEPTPMNPLRSFMIGFKSSNLFRTETVATLEPVAPAPVAGARRRRSRSASPSRVTSTSRNIPTEARTSPKRRRVE